MNSQQNGSLRTPSLARRILSVWSASHNLRSRIGLIRSVLMYYGQPGRRARMGRFYRQFLGPSEVAFDIGAHVGNRIQVWRDIGATVVAVEPQPACVKLLHEWYAQDAQVKLVDAAVGAEAGHEILHISQRTPTVTTISQEWQKAVQQVDSFASVEWEEQITVAVSTLNQLIGQYGVPTFCKIDVEGYELEVLNGLSQPVKALSLEYIPATPEITVACIDRILSLGNYEFNWSVGESHQLQRAAWLSDEDIYDIVRGFDINDNSGDLYARLKA